MIVEPLGSSSGLILTKEDSDGSVFDLPSDELKRLFKQAGVLLFRGFDVGPLDMKRFAGRLSSRFNRDRLRPQVDGSGGLVQLVNEGIGYAEAHSEQANSPFRPDAIWFCCETPPDSGGETFVVDGVRVWNDLDEDLKSLFATKKIRFFQRYAPERWKLFLGPDSTLDDVRRSLDAQEGVTYHVADDDSVYLEYVCGAVVKTKYGQEDAFVNSLLTERENTLGDLMSFEDGTPITSAIAKRVKSTMERATETIAWEPGDLAMIDNTRFLHGRNAFTDRRRRIYSCLSFLDF